MISFFITTILSGLGICLIGFCITYGLKLVKGIENVRDLLICHLVGLIAIASMYALFQTAGSTIFVLVLAIAALAYRHAPKYENYVAPKIDFKLALLPFIIFAAATFLVKGPAFNEGGLVIDQEVSTDHHFLANISYYIAESGEENEYHVLNTLASDYHGTSPYHYCELWMNAAVSEVFNTNFDHTLSLVLPALFYFILLLTLVVLYSMTLGKVGVLGWIICGAFVFFFGSLYPHPIKETGVAFLQNIDSNWLYWHDLKSGIYAIMIALFYIFWRSEKRMLAYLMLMLFSMIQITCIPAVFGCMALMGVYLGVFKKKKTELHMLGWLACISAAFLVQRHFFGNTVIQREATSPVEFVSRLLGDSEYLVQRMNIILKEGIFLILHYHLLLIAVIIAWKTRVFEKIDRQASLILAGMAAIGLLTYAALFEVVNSSQLYEMIIKPWMPLLFFVVLLGFLKSKGKLRIPVVICFGVFIVANGIIDIGKRANSECQYSSEYLAGINSFIQEKQEPPIGASFRNDYSSEYSSQVTIYTNGTYLSQLKNGACTVSMSDFDIQAFDDPLYEQRSKNGYKLGLMYREVQKQKEAGTFESVQRSQQDLMSRYQFPYAIFNSEYSVPEFLEPYVERAFTDSNTGEKFVILDWER